MGACGGAGVEGKSPTYIHSSPLLITCCCYWEVSLNQRLLSGNIGGGGVISSSYLCSILIAEVTLEACLKSHIEEDTGWI